MKRVLTYVMTGILLAIVLLAGVLGQTQGPGKKSGLPQDGMRTEVTKSDFTKLRFIRSTQLLTFGVALGQSVETAREEVQKAGLTWEIPTNPSAVIVVGNASGTALFGVNTEDGVITRVVWYAGLGPYLAGKSGRIVDFHVLDPDSPLRLRLLGREDSRDKQGLGNSGKIVTYSYDKEGLRVLGIYPNSDPNDPTATLLIHLVAPAKPR